MLFKTVQNKIFRHFFHSQSNKYSQATATSYPVTVTLVDKTVELKQTTRTKFNIFFSSAADIKLGDVAVEELVATVNGIDKVAYLIKDVTLSDDKKTATVELFTEFRDGVKYEVSVKGYDAATLVASKGAPTSMIIHVDPNQANIYGRNVIVNNNTTLYYRLYDANNVDVTTLSADERAKIDFKIKYNDDAFEIYGDNLFFTEAGQRALIVGEYHTGVYDNNGNEKDFFTSQGFTFVAVNRATTVVTKVDNFTAKKSWGNLDWHASDKDVVRLGEDVINNNNANVQPFGVQIVLSDNPYRKITLDSFGDIITDNVGNVLGAANFTSLTPDILDVIKRADNADVELYPRKEGTARIMVSYITNVNGYDVETPIAPITLKVQGKRKLTTVYVENAHADICIDPNTVVSRDDELSVYNPLFEVVAKDQYGANYHDLRSLSMSYSILPIAQDGIVGTNVLSQRAVTTGAIAIDNIDKNFNGTNTTVSDIGIRLDNAKFKAILDDMNNNTITDGTAGTVDAKVSVTNSATFYFTIKVKDSDNTVKTCGFSVTATRPIGSESYLLEMTDWTVSLNNNDVARTWSYSDNTKSAKEVKFTLYTKKNGAKYQEISATPYVEGTTDLTAAATNSYFYVVNKSRTPITNKINVTGDATPAHEITLAFSHLAASRVDPSKQIVYYDDEAYLGRYAQGAGSYQFILYKLVDHDNNPGTPNQLIRVDSKSIGVSCNTGSYSLVKRVSTSVDAQTQANLFNCFRFTDREGNGYDWYNIDYANNTVQFSNGQTRPFQVNLKNELTRPGSVYVDSVTFWEPIASNNTGVTAWAEYTVKVGYFVNVPQ